MNPITSRKRNRIKPADMAWLLRTQKVCQDCGEGDRAKLVGDHVKPIARGGRNTRINLALRCKRCNAVKSYTDRTGLAVGETASLEPSR